MNNIFRLAFSCWPLCRIFTENPESWLFSGQIISVSVRFRKSFIKLKVTTLVLNFSDGEVKTNPKNVFSGELLLTGRNLTFPPVSPKMNYAGAAPEVMKNIAENAGFASGSITARALKSNDAHQRQGVTITAAITEALSKRFGEPQ